MRLPRRAMLASTVLAPAAFLLGPAARAQHAAQPWLNPTLSPDTRATLVEQQMTPAEIYQLLDGKYPVPQNYMQPASYRNPGAVGGAGFIPGIPRLGVPALQETDGPLGVADPIDDTGQPTRGAAGYSTELPSGLATAATWNVHVARAGGAMIGNEAHEEGFNVVLAGGLNLAREPRNGRNFEYAGEDPLLAGTMVGHEIRGIQSNHVISTMKHYALNDQETGRQVLSADIGNAAARESDLLAFEIAQDVGHPGAVMCAYNRYNGVYACGNDYLLNQTLKRDWNYQGWVMSDWGAVHSALDINAGLDQESGDFFDQPQGGPFFTAPLQAAVANGQVLPATVYDAAHRILRSMFAHGLFEYPPPPPGQPTPIDATADAAVAQADEEQGAVLLKNSGALPLSTAYAGTIAVFGSNANNGVLEGGGSSEVWPVGGPAPPADPNKGFPHPILWNPSPPVAAIQALAPGATVIFDDGTDLNEAARRAQGAGVAIVFVNQWLAESFDAASLALPTDPETGVDQNALVSAVAAANPNTIVVVESGGPVTMPWLPGVAGVLEAWYPGSGGGPAIANLLFGQVNPSGHLPITFPASESQLPRPTIDGLSNPNVEFHVNYDIEGAAVGYKWFIEKGYTPLFPFGYGLSYTTFDYGKPTVSVSGTQATVSETVTNTGNVAGYGVAQMYAALPSSASAPIRLVAFGKVMLRPGESRTVTATIDPRLLGRFDEQTGRFEIPGGTYWVMTGSSAQDLAQATSFTMEATSVGP